MNPWKVFLPAFRTILLLLWTTPFVFLDAQSITQAIQGLVTDSSGAVVPGANITITNLSTGVSRSATTNATGNYSFQLVEVGNYRIRCSLEGFKTQTVEGVRVETGAQVRRNFVLEVGSITETVEVSALAVTLNTENATVGSVVENKRIIDLPLNGRNIVQLAVMVPGVQFGQRSGMDDGGGGTIPGQSFSVSANGQRELHQIVSLDGVDAASPRRSITPFVPSIEALEEFKIQTTTYSAEIGFKGGAVVNLTMKSGTNDFHGTFFEFLRNDKLDAESYFLNFERSAGEERSPKAPRRVNRFGVILSGPIVKNKTFWAFDWEARRDRTSVTSEGFFPPDSFRDGDFSELLTGTINPETGNLFRNPIVIYDPFTGEPFENNIIPKSRHHSGIVNNILPDFIPRADFRQTDPLDFTRRQALPRPIDSDQYFARVDHYFSDKDRIFGRLALDRSNRDAIRLNPNFGRFRDNKVNNVATQWVHTFNPTMLNEFRFGFQTFDTEDSTPRTNDESFDINALGIGEYRVVTDENRPLRPNEQGVPRMNLYSIDDRSFFNGPESYQVSNHISIIKGRHNLKMGYEWYHLRQPQWGSNVTNGRLVFGDREVGNRHAAFLMGIPNRTETPEGSVEHAGRSTRQGAYIQDDWKATPKLTINFGLRFDHNGVWFEPDGRWRTLNFPGEGRGLDDYVDPVSGQLIPTMSPEFVDERGGIKLWDQNVGFFMPRLGIAYRPADKWVLRMGAGWFDNTMHGNAFSVLKINPPLSSRLQFSQVTDPAGSVSVQGADGATYTVQTRKFRDPSQALTLDDPFLDAGQASNVGAPVSVIHIKPDYKDGDVWKWSFDVQRELPFSSVLTVGYVGSKGTHVANSIRNWNEAPPSPNTNFQVRRPYQRFFDPATPEAGIQNLSEVRYLNSYGNSFHHGLQVKYEKRYSAGLTLGLAYTFSKSHGDGEAGGNQSAQIQNPRVCRVCDRGRFRFDQRHNMVVNYTWEIPGANTPGVLKHIVGGWQSTGILSLRSGFPYGIRQGDALNTGGDAPARPDLVGAVELDNPTRKLWYNPAGFQRVTCNIPDRQDLCHFGNFGYNVLDSPGQTNLDFGFFKNFSLTERTRLQFRSEFFNAFNTPYFDSPGGISFSSVNVIQPDGARNGEIRSTRTSMRIIQFGLKLSF